ncbi:hypothetical protein BC826DRAFT_288975 [Russula brevipes]|nr:hypothetical protein BC826DRAFT_288975 [Russula brevipes]
MHCGTSRPIRPRTLATKYVITQHYFTVPLHMPDAEADRTDALMRMWCVSAPFEIVCVPEQVVDESATGAPREQPLFAVDFGHAAWLEHVRAAHDEEGGEEPDEHGQKRLRFVSFPGVRLESDGHVVRSGIGCGGGPTGRSRWRARCGRWRSRMSLTWTMWRRSASTRVKAR